MDKNGSISSSNKRWSLQGMTALVTGGTKGLGHAIVEELAELGARIYTCSRNEAELNDCLSLWKDKGFQVTGSTCDLSDRAQRKKLMEAVSSAFHGKLNILVNNAGRFILKPSIEYTEEDYSVLMSTNLESAFHLSQLAHPLLKSSGSGSIVFMSSASGVVSLGIGAVYPATKAAMVQLTKSLACEWAKDGIRSNCVAPWFFKTPLTESLFDDEKFCEALKLRTPVGRPGETKEVSALVAFFCLPAASYITGQTMCVDGGATINCFTPP